MAMSMPSTKIKLEPIALDFLRFSAVLGLVVFIFFFQRKELTVVIQVQTTAPS